MRKPWTPRQVLAQIGIAAAAVHTLDPHELCCATPAWAQTADKELFELQKVGDGVYAAIAAPRYKTNCNAAVIVTNDGVVVVDSHSKPSAARALDRKSTRLNSSHRCISYAVFCLKKKKAKL